MLTQQRLIELLTYELDTGLFRWRVTRNNKTPAGSVAGWTDEKGYIRIQIDGHAYRAHRLAWLCMTGAMPAVEIDHRDLVKHNNRWDNLREAGEAEQRWNQPAFPREAGRLKGAFRQPGSAVKPWMARIEVRGVRIYLGSFVTAEEAHRAYLEAANRLHGEFTHSASPPSIAG